MRLIPWTLRSGSKHFRQITFSKKFPAGIAMPLKILIKMLLFYNLKILTEPQQPGQDKKYRTVRTGQKSQDFNFKFAKKFAYRYKVIFTLSQNKADFSVSLGATSYPEANFSNMAGR